MDIKVNKLPKSRAEITVSIPWDEWKGEIDHAAAHLSQEMKVEGFRPGKVPRAVLEKRLGKATLLVEGAEHAIDHLYPEALSQSGVDAIGRPQIRLEAVKEGEPLVFVSTTAIMPDVSIRDWEGTVKAENAKHPKEAPSVTPEEQEEELRKLAESRAKFVTVLREAKDGDMVEVDFTVFRDGVPIEGGTGKKHPIVLGKGAFIPGFEEHLVGMKADDEKEFELVFPEQYHMEALAGKPATFRVKALLVQERELPVIDDAFAQSLGNFESLEKLRESIIEGMRVERENEAKEKRRTAILEALVGSTTAELPEEVVDGEVRRMITEFGNQASMMGMTLADYLGRLGKTEDDLAKDWRPQAEKRVLSGLVLEHLAKERDIRAEQEEIEAEMNKVLSYVKSIRQAEKDLDLPGIYSAAQSRIRNEKLFQLLENL